MVCLTNTEITSDKNGRVGHYIKRIPDTVTINDYFQYMWNGILPQDNDLMEQLYCDHNWFSKTDCLLGKILFEATITEPMPAEFG